MVFSLPILKMLDKKALEIVKDLSPSFYGRLSLVEKALGAGYQ